MSITHGGKAKHFKWSCQQGQVLIKNEDGKTHEYSIKEITRVLTRLFEDFGHKWIPLANNVQKMYVGTEISGLGSTIYNLRAGDIFHAQGASYLGVVLEEAGLFEWNGRVRGIKWRIVPDLTDAKIVWQALEKDRIDTDITEWDLSIAENGENQIPYTIDTHKHNFAIWAASRAAQRGFTTVENLRNAAEACGIKEAVIQFGKTNVDPKEYDDWHTDICRQIIKYLLNAGVENTTYGRAAKLVAVYLKVIVVIGGDPMCALARTAHPPIDRILLRNIAKTNPSLRRLAQVNWTTHSEAEYFDVINNLRNVLDEGSPFWEMEKHWTVTND